MKTLITSIILFILGLSLIGLFYLSGSTSEPLLPIGHLLAILGGMSTVVALIREGLKVPIHDAKV